MKVLITGIDGFVGGHLVRLLAGMHDVEIIGTIIGNEPATRPDVPAGRIRYLQADLRDRGRMAYVLEDVKPDRVVHLAGQAFVPASVQDPIGTYEVNVNGALNLLEGARSVRDRIGLEIRVLVVSSGEIYGRVDPSRQPVREDEPLRPANPYAASKAAMDLAAQVYNTTYGMEVIAARPFNHAGPGQSPSFVVSDFAKRIAEMSLGMRGLRLDVGNIHVSRDFTDVRDVVRAYWMILNAPLIGVEQKVVNVCSGGGWVIEEIIRALGEISGVAPDVAIDQSRVRSYDLPVLSGSNERVRALCGWKPEFSFRQTLSDVYGSWLDQLKRGK